MSITKALEYMTSEFKNKLLFLSIEDGNIEFVKLLLEDGADIEARNKIEQTPLIASIFWNYGNIFNLLINRDADVTAKDIEDYTVLHCVTMSSNFDIKIIETLIINGADINAQSKYGWTPLHFACMRNNIEYVKLLVRYGASIYIKNNIGYDANDVAIYYGNTDIAEYLTTLM